MNTLVQSFTLLDTIAAIASNTTDAVDILHLPTNQRSGQIPGVASPRYLAEAGPGQGYVSNLFSATVTVVDLHSESIAATVNVGSSPEDIAWAAERVYVANFGFGTDSTVTVIDPTTNTVEDTLDVGCDGPRHLEVGAEDEVWVFCTGLTEYNDDFTQIIRQTNGAAVVLNGRTGVEVARIGLDRQIGAEALGHDSYYSEASMKIFVIAGQNILVFDTALNTWTETIEAPTTGESPEPGIGGIAYDADGQQLYAARVVGYTVPGFVQIFRRGDLQEVDRVPAGIIPTQIAFKFEHALATEVTSLPTDVDLAAAWPNPFIGSTTLSYRLSKPATVRLRVYDLMGREVGSLHERIKAAGAHEIIWHAEGMPAGTYFVRLVSEQQVAVRSVVIAR